MSTEGKESTAEKTSYDEERIQAHHVDLAHNVQAKYVQVYKFTKRYLTVQ